MLGATLFGRPVERVTDVPHKQEVLIENDQGQRRVLTYEQLHKMYDVRHL